MKKKIIIGISASVIVIVAIAAGIVTGASSKKKSSNDINVSCKAEVTKNEDITCYDWLKKLCNKMGVEADDYRKAAKEYGYITDSDEFSNDDIASGGFMALTSMRAMGEGKMQIYLGTDDAISDNTNIELAINNNLIAEDSLDRGFSDQEADGILDKFDDLYYGEFWPEDIENVSYKENISQLQFFDIKDYKEDENIIYIDDIPEYSVANGYEVTKELLQSKEEFTALYAISDLTAFGAYKAISEAGKKIPDDYSVLGFDGIEMSKYFQPSLSTMKQPCEQMVKSSIELLMDIINGKDEKKQLIFQAELLERDSVKEI